VGFEILADLPTTITFDHYLIEHGIFVMANCTGSEQSNDLFSPVSRSPVSRSKPAADYNPFLD